jgi:hypothetical protein
MRLFLSILACLLLSCGATACFAGDSASCGQCLRVSDDSMKIIITHCPDSTTFYHVRKAGKKYRIDKLVLQKGKD